MAKLPHAIVLTFAVAGLGHFPSHTHERLIYYNPPLYHFNLRQSHSITAISHSVIPQSTLANNKPSKLQTLPKHAHQTSKTLPYKRQQGQNFAGMSQQLPLEAMPLSVLPEQTKWQSGSSSAQHLNGVHSGHSSWPSLASSATSLNSGEPDNVSEVGAHTLIECVDNSGTADQQDDNDTQIEDILPIRSTNTPGDRATLFSSTESDRQLAAHDLTLRGGRRELTSDNVFAHTQQSKWLVKQPAGIDQLDDFLHASLFAGTKDDIDGELATPDWDLPAALFDPTYGLITHGLDTVDKLAVTIDPDEDVQHILVLSSELEAVYIFALHGVVEFRGAEISRPKLLDSSQLRDVSITHPYSFDVGDLVEGIVIHSNQPLPRIYFDYHVYTENFPRGFPATGAQLAWCHDQCSPLYNEKLVDKYAPFTNRPEYRKLLGSSFTIQPMSTLSQPRTQLEYEQQERRISANARYMNDQNWAVKVRAGNMLMKLGSIKVRLLAEDWPWSRNMLTDPQDEDRVLMPFEGFWYLQEGFSTLTCKWELAHVGDHAVVLSKTDEYHRNARAWTAAKLLAYRNLPDHCSDPILQFMQWLPPDQWTGLGCARLANEADQQYLEHQAQNWAPCVACDYRCGCCEHNEEPEDEEKAIIMFKDSTFVQYDDRHMLFEPFQEQWLEHVQSYMAYKPTSSDSELGHLTWNGEDAFLLNTKGKNELNNPAILRKSGFMEKEKIVPTYYEFCANFQFESSGEVCTIAYRPQRTSGPLSWMPWIAVLGEVAESEIETSDMTATRVVPQLHG